MVSMSEYYLNFTQFLIKRTQCILGKAGSLPKQNKKRPVLPPLKIQIAKTGYKFCQK